MLFEHRHSTLRSTNGLQSLWNPPGISRIRKISCSYLDHESQDENRSCDLDMSFVCNCVCDRVFIRNIYESFEAAYRISNYRRYTTQDRELRVDASKQKLETEKDASIQKTKQSQQEEAARREQEEMDVKTGEKEKELAKQQQHEAIQVRRYPFSCDKWLCHAVRLGRTTLLR